ncbi:hypothetical protein AB7Z58_02705 [Escherichia coli]
MSNIDKQAVQAVADLKAGYTLGHADVGILNELARIALASLEAEPVAWLYSASFERGHVEGELTDAPGCDMPVYTSPPAPVSVPDLKGLDEFIFNLVSAMASEELSHNEKELFSIASKYISYARERFSPAMLQGAEPVTTAYKLPDDFDLDRFNDVVWLEAVASNPHMHSLTTSTIAMVALDLNRKLADRNSTVIQDGWVMVPVEPTAEMLQSGISAHYERSQIQIHDRPAPGPMECAYAAMLAAAPQQEVKP